MHHLAAMGDLILPSPAAQMRFRWQPFYKPNKMKSLYLTITLLSLSCTNPNPVSEDKTRVDTLLIPSTPILISDSLNTLEKEIKTLKLQFTLWGCACANWISSDDAKNYRDSNFVRHHIFIEPADSNIYNPEGDTTFQFGSEKIIVVGQFYKDKDYPHPTYQMEEPIAKAKVFRYTKIKRIKEAVSN